MIDPRLDLDVAMRHHEQLIEMARHQRIVKQLRDHERKQRASFLGWTGQNLAAKLGTATAAAVLLALIVHN